MDSADRDGHPPDADRERVTPERPEMERFDGDPGIEAKMTQAARFGLIK